MTLLADLSPARQALVLAAVVAVETADEPVKERDFTALNEPDLRNCVQHCLHEAGRTLLRRENGFTSGYADDVAEAFADEGIGLLGSAERAVLVLVLLHCVAIPRAKGRITGTGWSQGEPIDRAELLNSQVPDGVVHEALRQLAQRGLVRYHGRKRLIAPGPQLSRLTPAVAARLWEEMVLLAEPDGVMAEVIRRRRSRERQNVQEWEL